jgi:hypothetical protein
MQASVLRLLPATFIIPNKNRIGNRCAYSCVAQWIVHRQHVTLDLPADWSQTLQHHLSCLACRDEFSAFVADLLALHLTNNTLPGMMLEVAAAMASNGHILQADAQLMQAWISDLAQAGYTFPALWQTTTSTATSTAAAVAASGRLTPDVIMQAPLERTCVFPHRWCLHQDKAMVVNFVNFNRLGQHNSVQQIKLLHAAYRPLFFLPPRGGAGPMALMLWLDSGNLMMMMTGPCSLGYCSSAALAENQVWNCRSTSMKSACTAAIPMSPDLAL